MATQFRQLHQKEKPGSNVTEGKIRPEIRHKYGAERQVFCTKVVGLMFLLGKWGKQTEPLFLYTNFEKTTHLYIFKSYICREYHFFREQS